MLDILPAVWMNFFRLILALIHFAYSGLQYFDIAYSTLNRKINNFLNVHAYDTELYVSSFVQELKKRPSHFVIITGKDGLACEDFSNIVLWCLAAKITFLSFYDHKGKLKANQNIYYNYLIGKKKINKSNLAFSIHSNAPKNGVSPKIFINFLSLVDGKASLVQLTKDLSKRVLLNNLKITDINEQYINEELFKLNGFPEPDLALISGSICSTFGLLPWHLKVTEFVQIRTLKNMRVTDFTSVLKNYSSCTQRFGK